MYIYLDGKYFNVIKDKEALLSNLTEGYYVNASKFTKTNGKEENVFGTKQYLRNAIKERYESSWINDDIWNYIDFVPEYKVKIKPKESISLSVNNQNLLEYELNVRNDKNIYDQIKNDEAWFSRYETTGICATRNIFKQRFKDKDNNSISIELTPKGGYWYCYTDHATPSINLDVIDTSTFKYNLYKTKQGKENKTQSEILGTIELEEKINHKLDLPTHILKEFYQKWFNNYFFDNEFLKFTSSSQINEYGVEKDRLYSINFNSKDHNSFLSLKESLAYFKNEIKPNVVKDNSEYKINDVRFSEEEINNSFYLKQYTNYRKMYNHFDTDHLTSLYGSDLYHSKWEAEERQKYHNNSGILNKRYFVYHLQTKKTELSAATHEEAVEMYSKTLKLEAKYVHNDEIKSWKNKNVSFDLITTDGRYVVYRIINKNHQNNNQPVSYFYYQSYDDAIKSIRKSVEHNITVVNKYIKLYVYKDKNNASHLFTYKDDKEINEIIDKIISLN